MLSFSIRCMDYFPFSTDVGHHGSHIERTIMYVSLFILAVLFLLVHILLFFCGARTRIEVESPMKRMMEKGKGKRRTQTKCRANKRRRCAALSTREAEETKADHRNNLQLTEAARSLNENMKRHELRKRIDTFGINL